MSEVDVDGVGVTAVEAAGTGAAGNGVTEGSATEDGARIDVILDAVAPDAVEDDLRSLLRWLRADENLAGLADARPRDGALPPPGSMGTAFDILQLTIGSGLSVGSLVVSVLQWRDARRPSPVIRLRHGRTTVEIPATGEVDTDALTRALLLLTAPPLPAAPTRAAAAPAPAPVPTPAPTPDDVPADAAPRATTAGTEEAAGDGTPS